MPDDTPDDTPTVTIGLTETNPIAGDKLKRYSGFTEPATHSLTAAELRYAPFP